MIEIQGDIWNFHARGKWVVIPTNGVFNPRTGKAVMGKGLARQAAVRFPGLPFQLGRALKEHGNQVFCFPVENLFTFPTKHHWRDDSSLELIIGGCRQMAEMGTLAEFFLPRLGCGLGNLSWENQVRPAIRYILDHRFNIVEYQIARVYPTPLEVNELPDSAWPTLAEVNAAFQIDYP